MLVILNITLLLIVIYHWKRNEGFLFAPEIAYNLPFLLAAFNWLTNAGLWGDRLRLNTYLIIVSGSLFFTGGCRIAKIMHRYTHREYNECRDKLTDGHSFDSESFIPIFFFISIIVVLIAIIGSRSYLTNLSEVYSEGGNVLSGSALYNSMNKETGDNTLSIPRWVNMARKISFTFAYLNTYILVRNWFSNHRKCEWLALMHILLTYYLSLLFGARQVFIRLVLVLATMIWFFGWRRNRLLTNSFQSLLCYAVLLIAGLFVFYILAFRIGRTDRALANPYSYLSIYMGAPLKNFDDWINGTLWRPVYATSQFWGQQTLAKIWNRVLGLSQNQVAMQWNAWQPYQSINGITLGNVYTQYYTLIFDWGISGAIITVFIIGFISEYFYIRAWLQIDQVGPNMSLLLYSNIVYGLVFSYFLNFLFTNLVTIDFLEQLVLAFFTWQMMHAIAVYHHRTYFSK